MISTYTRLEKLRGLVDSLALNPLANQSSLYIYSDGPITGDEGKVNHLREYLKTINGFKVVNIIQRPSNYGSKKNGRLAISQLLDNYGKIIFLEDDNIVAPGFLKFMNDGLSLYQNNNNVFSICGYTPAIDFTDNSNDIVAFPRFIAWGVGYWSRSYQAMTSITAQRLANLSCNVDISKRYGSDLPNRFKAEINGHLNSLDTRATFAELVSSKISVHPKRSLVKNIGHDGSGLHSNITNKFDVKLWTKLENFMFDEDIKLNSSDNNKIANFFSISSEEMSIEILQNILSQIKAKGWISVSLWGLDCMTTLMLPILKKEGISVEYIIDSWASEGEKYQEFDVINLNDALKRGVNNIAIMSFASRFKMLEIVKQTQHDLEPIYYQAKENCEH